MYPDIVDDRSRALLDAIAANGGVVGIIAYNQPDLDAFVDDIEYVIRAVGPDHVALGTDFFGIERAPTGLRRWMSYQISQPSWSNEVIRMMLSAKYWARTTYASSRRCGSSEETRLIILTAIGSGVGAPPSGQKRSARRCAESAGVPARQDRLDQHERNGMDPVATFNSPRADPRRGDDTVRWRAPLSLRRTWRGWSTTIVFEIEPGARLGNTDQTEETQYIVSGTAS